MKHCSRFLWSSLAAAGLVLLVVGCGGQPEPISTNIPTPVQTSTPEPPAWIGEAAEAWNLLAQRGGMVWDGWGQTLPPLLISKGSDDFLAGHPHPPDGFELAEGLKISRKDVFRRAGHLVPAPSATTWNVAGVWSVAVPERSEFQAAVDKVMGQGKVTIDPPAYVRSTVHEAFHAYQFTLVNGNPPDFGSTAMEKAVMADLLSRPGVDAAYTAEGQALASALRMTGKADILAQTRAFLKLRQERRATLAPAAGAYEQSMEWTEGLARYAEVSLVRLAGGEDYKPTLASLNYPSPEKTWEQFLNDLSRPTQDPDIYWGRYYLMGAGQAFLLDQLLPGWKERALVERQSLEALLQEAVK